MSENKESRPRAVPGSCRLERRRLLQGAVGATVAMALPGAASAQMSAGPCNVRPAKNARSPASTSAAKPRSGAGRGGVG